MNSNLTRWTRLKLAVQSLRRFLTPTTEAWSVATWLMLAALLYPQIMGQTLRIEALNSAAPSEIVLRRYEYPLKDFAAANPHLDLTHLHSVRFDFDRTTRGVIVLSDVGLAKMY